jgi:hypothetical protein
MVIAPRPSGANEAIKERGERELLRSFQIVPFIFMCSLLQVNLVNAQSCTAVDEQGQRCIPPGRWSKSHNNTFGQHEEVHFTNRCNRPITVRLEMKMKSGGVTTTSVFLGPNRDASQSCDEAGDCIGMSGIETECPDVPVTSELKSNNLRKSNRQSSDQQNRLPGLGGPSSHVSQSATAGSNGLATNTADPSYGIGGRWVVRFTCDYAYASTRESDTGTIIIFGTPGLQSISCFDPPHPRASCSGLTVDGTSVTFSERIPISGGAPNLVAFTGRILGTRMTGTYTQTIRSTGDSCFWEATKQ